MCSSLFSSLLMIVGPNKNKYQENVSASNIYLQYSRNRDADTLFVVVKLVPDFLLQENYYSAITHIFYRSRFVCL